METETVVEIQEPLAPTGEEMTPEPVVEAVEGIEAPVVSEEETQEKEAIKAAGLTEDTPAAHEFAKLRREKRDARKSAEEAKLEAARWRGRAEALAERGQKEVIEATVQPAPADMPRPQEGDFEDYGAYTEALADWKVEQKFAQKIAQYETTRAQTESEKARDAWVSQGVTKFGDFKSIVTLPFEQGGPAINRPMADFINSSPVSHEIAYHLGKNLEESRRIAQMDPMNAARELTKIETRLSGGAPVKPKLQTNAPAPIKPIAGDGATAEVFDLEKATEAEYIAYQNKKEFGARK